MLCRKKALLFAAIVLILAGGLLAALPYALQYALRSWSLQHGADQVAVENVDFNPFTGRLALSGVRIAFAGDTTFSLNTLSMKMAWGALFSKRFLLNELSADGWHIRISASREGLRVGGLLLPQGAKTSTAMEDKPWGLGIDRLQLANGRIALRLPQINSQLAIRHLQLQTLVAWSPDRPAALKLAARIDGTPLDFRGEIRPFAAPRQLQGRLKIKGLALGPLLATVVSDLQAKLQMDATVDVRLSPQGAYRIQQSGRLGLRDFAWQTPGARIRGQQLAWQGRLQLAQSAAAPLALKGQGKLTGQGLHGIREKPALLLSNGDFSWQGKVGWQQQDQILRLTGDLELQQVRLKTAAQQPDVLKLDVLALQGIDVQGADRISVSALTARRWEMGAAAQQAVSPLVRVAVLHAGPMAYTGQDFDLGMLELSGLDLRLQRNRQGQWNTERLRAQLQALQGHGPEWNKSSSGPPTGSSPGTLRIGGIVVQKAAHLVFQDEGVRPSFSLSLQTDRFEIGALNSARPQQPTAVQLSGRLGQHGRLAIRGSIWPFSAPPGFKVQADVGALELYPLSSYTAPALGFRLRSGTLDARAKIAARQGKLDGRMKLTIRELDLTSLNNEQTAKLTGLLNMPLDLALNVLRDDHNTIHLQLPVSGNPAAPDFDFSDALNQALAVGLKQGAMSYLSMMLQPYGTIISVAKFAGEQITRLRLDPVVFASATAQLTDQARDYLDHVARVLAARPQVAIKLCGIAVSADR